MDDAFFQDYLTSRYLKEIAFYEKYAAKNKLIYSIIQWIVIVLSAAIPVLIVTLEDNYKLVTASLGILLAIGTAGLKAFKYQETWVNYRTIAETLKKEKYFYDAGLEGYGEAFNSMALFVERVEALISREHSLWVSVQRQRKGKNKEST